MFWQRKDFKVQQALWYSTIKAFGFEDIEYGRDTDSTTYMHDEGTRYRLGKDHADLHVGADILEHAVQVSKRVSFFKTLEERYIWTRSTEGATPPEIAVEIGRSRVHVWRVLERIKERMHGH